MNLPDIHTQKLLDCLTHSHLGFALYRLPWTDECYLVLQTSGDVEQLADIQELNGKKGWISGFTDKSCYIKDENDQYIRISPKYKQVSLSKLKILHHCGNWVIGARRSLGKG